MKIAVIGGTGLQDMSSVELVETHQVNTEYSENPVVIREFKIEQAETAEQRFFFLGRHGSEQKIPPHLINYRANLSALSSLAIESILAVTAVGGVAAGLGVGDLVVPDQIIDYTWGRESTFFDGGEKGRRHIDFTCPYTDQLRKSLLLASNSCFDRRIHDGGIYACTQGPRLETAAEVKSLQRQGVEVVGMTGMPEAALARELGIDYAALSVVVNPAAGLSTVELSEQDIEAECRRASADISALLISTINMLMVE